MLKRHTDIDCHKSLVFVTDGRVDPYQVNASVVLPVLPGAACTARHVMPSRYRHLAGVRQSCQARMLHCMAADPCKRAAGFILIARLSVLALPA